MKQIGHRIIAVAVLGTIGAGIASGSIFALRNSSTTTPELAVSEAVVVQPPAGRNIAAAYMTLQSTVDDHLVAVHSEQVEHIEIHRSVANGKRHTRMEKIQSVALPAHRKVEFAPGGLHLMLFGVAKLSAGQNIKMTLHTESGHMTDTWLTVTAKPPRKTTKPTQKKAHHGKNQR